MPSSNYVWGSAMGGAAAGSVFGVPGAIVGGTLGLIGGFLGTDPEEERMKRKKEAIRSLRAYLSAAKGMDIKAAKEAYLQEQAFGRQQAGRMGASSGVSDTAAYLAPIEQRAAGGYSQQVTGVARDYAKEEARGIMEIEGAFANRPIEPDVGEQLLGYGSEFAKNMLTNQYLKNRADLIGQDQAGAGSSFQQLAAPPMELAPDATGGQKAYSPLYTPQPKTQWGWSEYMYPGASFDKRPLGVDQFPGSRSSSFFDSLYFNPTRKLGG